MATSRADSGQLSFQLQPERRIFQVSELNSAVQNLFEAEFRSIWVAGEISSCRTAPSGHYYFSLKDELSQLKCALFKGTARFAKFKPQDGLAVIARGNLEVYEARGEYQLIVELLEPRGAGALQIAFEQLKRKLAAEGLFEQDRKRRLPKLPRRIGIVTSPSGAVIRDMLHVLERRFQGLHIRLFPTQVQGEGSVEQLCQGLAYFSNTGWADVVILARGGGSLEDLWSFNEEAVARAIVASTVPIISAVGHETDFTIADFVADHRAPTPSAAAEIVICTRESLLEQIAAYRAKAVQAVRYSLAIGSRDLQQRGAARSANLLYRGIARRMQRVDDLESQLRRSVERSVDLQCKRFEKLSQRLRASDLRVQLGRSQRRQEELTRQLSAMLQRQIWEARRRSETLGAQLIQLSPLAVLDRGYAIVQNAQNYILRSAAEAQPDEQLFIRLHHGRIEAVVSSTRDD